MLHMQTILRIVMYATRVLCTLTDDMGMKRGGNRLLPNAANAAKLRYAVQWLDRRHLGQPLLPGSTLPSNSFACLLT